jgi:hypothetical protein
MPSSRDVRDMTARLFVSTLNLKPSLIFAKLDQIHAYVDSFPPIIMHSWFCAMVRLVKP